MSSEVHQTEFDCTFLRETSAAVFVEIEGERHWIPFSQVTAMHRDKNGEGSIVFSQWIAQQKGLI